jgi:hypothetical protein
MPGQSGARCAACICWAWKGACVIGEAVEKKNCFSLLTSIYDAPLIPGDFHRRAHAHDPIQIIDSFNYLKKNT